MQSFRVYVNSFFSGFGGLWGMLAVGIFAEQDNLEGFNNYNGLMHGGGLYLLGVQTLASVCFMSWASFCTFCLITVKKPYGPTACNVAQCR
jgi:ammonia channel protein AmtB